MAGLKSHRPGWCSRGNDASLSFAKWEECLSERHFQGPVSRLLMRCSKFKSTLLDKGPRHQWCRWGEKLVAWYLIAAHSKRGSWYTGGSLDRKSKGGWRNQYSQWLRSAPWSQLLSFKQSSDLWCIQVSMVADHPCMVWQNQHLHLRPLQ